MKPIRVLIVDDSAFFCMATTRSLAAFKDIETIGYACDAFEAKDKILQLKPDVLTLDINMPRVNGLDFLDVLMREHPMPVIVVSGADGVVFEAIKRGAVDFVQKSSMAGFIEDLVSKIRIASKAKQLPAAAPAQAAAARPRPAPQAAAPARSQGVEAAKGPVRVIAIGASTGGTEATSNILKLMAEPGMPAQWPGIVVTQHMPPVFTRQLAQRLDRLGPWSVAEAGNGDTLRPGHVYVAPGDHHLEVRRAGPSLVTHLTQAPPENFCRPAVDVLFRSAVAAVGGDLLAVVLTGMGADGRAGAERIVGAGGTVVVQDEPSSVVWGMPGAVATAGWAHRVVPLAEMAMTIGRAVEDARRTSVAGGVA